MIVTVTKPFGPWARGQVIPDMPGNQARTLIGRGLVVEGAVRIEDPAKPGLIARTVAKVKGKGR